MLFTSVSVYTYISCVCFIGVAFAWTDPDLNKWCPLKSCVPAHSICKGVYKTSGDDHIEYLNAKLFKNVYPQGFAIRFSVYIVGEGNAKISLETSNGSKSGYEIIIGADNNTRSIFNLPGGRYTKTPEIYKDGLLSIVSPRKFTIEVSDAGIIKVYADQEITPLIEAIYFPKFEINYIGLASNQGAIVKYYYDCDDITQNKEVAENAASMLLNINTNSIVVYSFSVLLLMRLL